MNNLTMNMILLSRKWRIKEGAWEECVLLSSPPVLRLIL